MKKHSIYAHEINESIAAKAAMNCYKKRMLKELYIGRPAAQEEVVNGDYDPYEWEFDDYGNEDKRQLVIQALVQAGLIQSEQEGGKLNNRIQQLLDKSSFDVSSIEDAMTFVKSYGRQIVGGAQEQEEDYSDDSHGIEMIIDLMVAKQLISDGERTRQIAKELIERKLDEEGMWIGDDEHEAERFVEFFGEDMAEEISYWRW